jgi:hypothetical protein
LRLELRVRVRSMFSVLDSVLPIFVH